MQSSNRISSRFNLSRISQMLFQETFNSTLIEMQAAPLSSIQQKIPKKVWSIILSIITSKAKIPHFNKEITTLIRLLHQCPVYIRKVPMSQPLCSIWINNNRKMIWVALITKPSAKKITWSSYIIITKKMIKITSVKMAMAQTIEACLMDSRKLILTKCNNDCWGNSRTQGKSSRVRSSSSLSKRRYNQETLYRVIMMKILTYVLDIY